MAGISPSRADEPDPALSATSVLYAVGLASAYINALQAAGPLPVCLATPESRRALAGYVAPRLTDCDGEGFLNADQFEQLLDSAASATRHGARDVAVA